tara:strand:- start:323 stop:781 length:459 start_codon:yes stop_codon:yes gene_type:complete
MADKKNFTVNRKARFNYEILETTEAGLVLQGSEIKAIREGRANISEAFARDEAGEMWLFNVHISPYSAAGITDHDPTRQRKLLLNKQEIIRLTKQLQENRLALVPLRLYQKRHRVKVELGLGRGKRQYDKRRTIIDRQREKEARIAIKREAI